MSTAVPTLAAASRALAAGETTATGLLERVLERVAAVEPAVRAFAHLDAPGARAAAAAADAALARGARLGALHGIPYAVKDNYDAAGLPAEAGSRLRQGRVAPADAALVARARAAGAVLLGKLSTWEYGTGNGGEYFDLPLPPVRNPWDGERFAGGSSTGAGAAVAAGLVPFALGSDTTGSVRLPAAATGVVGLKPTQGLLPAAGILPNCFSLDVPGPLAWTVEDLALVLDALAGTSAVRALGGGVAGLRLGLIADAGPGLGTPDPAMLAALHDAADVLRRLGARVEPTGFPVPVADCLAASALIGSAESASIHEHELRERPGVMGAALRDKLMAGSLVRAADYLAAQRLRRHVALAMDAMLGGFDAVVAIGALHVAPRLGVEPEMTAFTRETAFVPASLSGHPSLVQCTGLDAAGLPLSWQVLGRRGDEATVLRLAHAYEAATPWRERRPAMTAGARA